MFDLEKIKHGYFAKGMLYLQQGKPSEAKTAFEAAGDFPNARRQLPFILRDLGATAPEIIGSLITTLDSGDLQALPWIIQFCEEFDFSHPDIEHLKEILESEVARENQSVLLGLMRIAREDQDVVGYVRRMNHLVGLSNAYARCELVNLIMQAETFPDEYKEFLKQQDALPVLGGQIANFSPLERANMAEDFLKEGDFYYLIELLNQGPDSVASGANILKFYLDMRMRRLETFQDFIQDLTQSLDSRWEDPQYLIVFAIEVRTNMSGYDLGPIKRILKPFGLEDFLSELLQEVPAAEDSLFDDDLGVMAIVRASSMVPTDAALNFFEKYRSPLFDVFTQEFKTSPVAAAKKYSEYISKSMKGDSEYFQPTAAAIEFFDRGYYDFDLVDPMLHGLVMRELPSLIETNQDISGAFLEFLYLFENGEAYFLDDIRRRVVNHPNAPQKVRDDFYSIKG
jgi:hypothetical protein